ncbi:MAG: hypothetical protein HYX69_12340 [Planctomycetia bacterium]|nr:hypothetical protein [Planctomycetia bacterium]
MSRRCAILLGLLTCVAAAGPTGAAKDAQPEARRPASDAALRYWLTNMVWHHRYSMAEMQAATGLPEADIRAALDRFAITPDGRPARRPGDPLRLVPYPGGRHPRIGFLEGAIRPQRETKLSVFAPWDDDNYAVVDLPEAIWSNLGLLYLAHTHVPTVWTKQGIELDRLEWRRYDDGHVDIERTLPDGVRFGATARATAQAVRMELWLANGSSQALSDLRVQMCVMLKGMKGFTAQTNDNKTFSAPYAACRGEDGRRWVITAWSPNHRTWANEKCPCLHSDPKFPDCPPGETRRLRGWLSFYEGQDIRGELARIDATGWRNGE